MDWSKSAQVLAINSYKRVFGSQLPIDAIAELIEDTMSNIDDFPYEVGRPELKRMRLQINNYADNEQLNQYFAAVNEVDSDFFHSMAAFDRVFELSKYVNAEPVSTPQEEPEEIPSVNNSTTVEEISTEPANVENKSNPNVKETKKMEMNSTPMDRLQAMAAGEAAGISVNNESNAQASVRDKQVAKQYMEESNNARIEFSKNAKIVKMFFQSMLRSELALDGKNAMGTISKPAAVMEKFKVITGMHVGDDNQYHYNADIDYREAEEMRKAIESAIANPEAKFAPKMESSDKPSITVKGILVEYDGKTELIPQKKIANTLISKTIGTLYGPTAENAEDTLQFFITSATNKTSRGKKKSAYSVRVANKDVAAEDSSIGVKARVIDDSTDQEQRNANFKSELSVRYTTKRTNAEGQPIRAVYRFPLNVPCHKLRVIPEATDLYSASGVGHAQKMKPIDEVISESSKFIDILAEMKASNALPSDIADRMSEIDSVVSSERADASAAMVGASAINPSDI